MNFGRFSWDIIRSEPSSWRLTSRKAHNSSGSTTSEEKETQNVSILSIFGNEGSIWGTREFRLAVFHVDEGPVKNIFLLPPPSSSSQSLAIDVRMKPCKHGSQAGILYYIDDLNWIKLVYEGNKTNSTMLILAINLNGDASVVRKVDPLPIMNDGNQFLHLRLQVLQPSSGMSLLYSASNLPEERVEMEKSLTGEGRFGLMAHSFSEASEEFYRWADFQNPSLT